MFLQALSTGIALVPESENVGVGVRANFGYRDENRFGAKIKWGKKGYEPVSDIERVLAIAHERHDTITTIALDGCQYNLIRKSDEVKARYAASIGNFTGNAQIIPVPSQFDALMADEFKIKFLVIDRTVRIEKNGKQTPVRPFAENTLVFLTTEQVGRLVYGVLPEEIYKVSNVEYQKVDNFILVSKYARNEPLREFTTSQALVLPVIENVDSIYIMDTQDAVEMAADEIEGDDVITLYGEQVPKLAVIYALKSTGIKTAQNISDEKLIAKINALSDAGEEQFKAALTASYAGSMTFTSAADTTGQTLAAEAQGELTAVSDETWATATVAGNVVTVKVTANSGAARTANITLSADGRQGVILVKQAGA
jgi:hypothetical protein